MPHSVHAGVYLERQVEKAYADRWAPVLDQQLM